MPPKKSNEIRIVRVYDAPVPLVWEAWTDPQRVAQWWGPRGFTLTTHSKDLRAGGHWTYTMHGPDGVDYPNKTIYGEVEKNAKLVYDHGGNDDRPPLFRVTVLFADVNGKTRMDMRMTLPTPEAAEDTRRFIKKAGGDATWDRLAEYVEKTVSGKDVFVIHRTFDAPRDVVFDRWTIPDLLARWLPPAGFGMRFIEANLAPGGQSFYAMTGPGVTLHGKVDYVTVEKPDLLVYAQRFCDANGGPARHPLAPTFPDVLLTTVRLAEEAPDQTRVTVTWEVRDPATPGERETFNASKAGMTQGWTGSFDKLEALLAAR